MKNRILLKKNSNDEINEFVALEYSTDQLIYYNVLDFSLTNKSATVDVFPEFFVDPFPIKNLFCAILKGEVSLCILLVKLNT